MSRYLVACDAGGTMTDVIIVDEEGKSVIGKAPTSPQDESIGYMESFWEALEYMGISKEEGSDFGKEVEARGDAQREEFSDGLRIGFLKPATGNEVDDANGVIEPKKHRDENSRS